MMFIKTLLTMLFGLVSVHASMMDLPEDTQKHVLKFCSRDSLCRLAQTCTFLKTMSEHENDGRVKRIMRQALSLNNNENTSEGSTVVSVSFPPDGNIRSLPLTGWDEFVSIQVLNMSFNPFQNLPSTMSVMNRLEELHIENVGMKVFSEVILSITTLTYIDLSHNHLKEIPEGISNLVNLKKIYLSHNALTHLPKSMDDLPLDELDISFNMFKTLPNNLKLFAHEGGDGSILIIRCNPIEFLARQVFDLFEHVPAESFRLSICNKQYAYLQRKPRFSEIEDYIMLLKLSPCECK
ncbi:MAG: leucine-rich repeat domain-containing protein [Alphaproteobacteria bacterium]|nr:leucine-rich repeat domain-containing protein [Alphaproteobacteria bacterium]